MHWLQRRRAQKRTDAELVQRMRAGRRNEYAELMRRHQDVLYRHARGMGLDHDTALDLVQDSFIKAFTRLDECHNPDRFRAWLFRIARNVCLDHLKNVRRLTIPLSAVPYAENLAADTHDVDLSNTLREALASLPEALREAFLLKHDANWTYEEIAELTEASPSAVKMRVHRAREAMREFLIENGVHAA